MSRFVVWFYRAIGWRFLGGTVLLLTTTGRRTGRPRTIAIHYQLHDGVPVICASNAGRPRAPAWLLNLRANPQVTIQRGSDVRSATAAELERGESWQRWIAQDPNYARMAGPGRRYPLVGLGSPSP